ncbi:hypothetical protein [Lysinibacillus fusiformis]|uniref:hypothetical protein n=1 Tax=Lysinibacillus fusiformis TaxID=28031 RepID=UPI001881A272|nr:hypothetical protein [Lysinibacillus fusiformis]MBD8523756.1 hypothetical protein [Lysinibacillus fusiformis]
MKITDFIFYYLIVAISTFFIVEATVDNTKTFAKINHQHEAAFTIATQDAINILRTNVQPKLQFGYESYKINPANPQPALDTFLQSLAINYGVEDKINADYLSRYVPVFAIVDYDGLLLNVYKKYQGHNGEELDRVWLPKIPFSYSDDEGNVVNFTIDEDIEVYDSGINEWFYGKREEVIRDGEVTVPLLNNQNEFDQVRRTTIVNVLQENLAYYINEHNVYSKGLDVTYKFALPLIDQEDWYNTVDDISILAFMQGNPYKYADDVYHEYAFVGARLNKTDQIKAGIVNGERRFWYASCGFIHKATELYSTKKQAAAAGYRELSCLNPTK